MGIPHAAPLLLLSNHEPLRWVHGWGPVAGLRARTQESRAVSLAIPTGAETSGRVPMLTHCRSAQLTKQVLLQDAMRLSGATYIVGSGRRAHTVRHYGENVGHGRALRGWKEAARSLSSQLDNWISQRGGQLELQHLGRRPTGKARGDPDNFKSSAEMNSACGNSPLRFELTRHPARPRCVRVERGGPVTFLSTR